MSRSPSLPATFLVLLALSTLAIALPLFTTLGQGATFFVAHNAQAVDIWAFAARVYLVPPLLLSMLVWLVNLLIPSWGRLCIALLAGSLAALWALGLSRQLPMAAGLIGAAGVGLVCALCYLRSAAFASFLQFMGWCSPLALIAFLQFSAAGKLLDTSANIEAGMVAPSDTPVVMLILDELSQAAIANSDGTIDSARLPNFARLAAMSTWYSNTTTVSTHTERAIASILSGKHTEAKTAPVYSQFPQNIFTVLAASHSVYATETVSRLCPDSVCQTHDSNTERVFDRASMYADIRVIWWHSILPPRLAAQWLPAVSSSWKGFSVPATADADADDKPEGEDLHWFAAMVADLTASDQKRFANFVEAVSKAEDSSFHYLHLALPHTPWIYLPDGKVYNGRFTPGQSDLAYDWQSNQFLIDQGAVRYNLQVEYVDKLLGDLLDALEAHPRADDFLLVVGSDHGVAFAPGEMRRRPVSSTLADVARVPLFIRYPSRAGGTQDTRPAQTIDILPTMAEVLGLPLSEPIDGSSLVSLAWKPSSRFIWEGRDIISDIEAEQDMDSAIARIQRAVLPGHSSMDKLTAMTPGTRNATLPSLRELASAGHSAMTLQLQRPEWYANINTDSAFVPARLTGWLRGAAPGTEIVVYLNGEAAASGESYGSENEVSLMLDTRLLRDGANTIAAYALQEGVFVAVPLTKNTEGWELTTDKSGAVTRVSFGAQSWQLANTASGHLAFARGGTALGGVTGWAYHTVTKQAAEHLLLLDGNRVISTGFKLFPVPTHAAERSLQEDLPYWFSLEGGPELRARGKNISLLALFEDGSFAHIQMK